MAAKKKTGPAPEKANALDAAEAEIIEAMRNGEGFRSIAARYGVSIGLLSSWSSANPERHHACLRAREDSADQCDEEAAQAIADAADAFELAKARELAVHLRWRAKSRNPRRYGDKVAVGGADDLPPIKTMTDDQLVARAAALTKQLGMQ